MCSTRVQKVQLNILLRHTVLFCVRSYTYMYNIVVYTRLNHAANLQDYAYLPTCTVHNMYTLVLRA